MAAGEWKSVEVSAATRNILAVITAPKRKEEYVAMSETAIYKLEKFISSGEPSVKLLFEVNNYSLSLKRCQCYNGYSRAGL